MPDEVCLRCDGPGGLSSGAAPPAASDAESQPDAGPAAQAVVGWEIRSSPPIDLEAVPDTAMDSGNTCGLGSNTGGMDAIDEDLQTAIAMSLSAEEICGNRGTM